MEFDSKISDYRFHNHYLSSKKLDSVEEVVYQFSAMQSQDYPGAKWSLGLRLLGATNDTIDQTIDKGKILRTHVLRPTWHFVDPKAIRSLLKLTRARINSFNGYAYRYANLNEDVFRKSSKVIRRALEGGKRLTREELALELKAVDIEAKGLRLVYLLMRAELDAIICSGPRKEKKITYALLDERFPDSGTLEKSDALKLLARRYFERHGPATAKDFAWWSGLNLNDAKEGVQKASSYLESNGSGSQMYWFPKVDEKQVEIDQNLAILLPTFDEFFVGYASFDKFRRGGTMERTPKFNSPLLIGGKVSGSWRRDLKKDVTKIEVASFGKLKAGGKEEVIRAAERYGRFIRLRVECLISPDPKSS